MTLSIARQPANSTDTISRKNLLVAKNSYVIISVIAFLIQPAIYPNLINLLTCSIALFSSILTAYYLFRPKVMGIFPISSLQILFFQFVSTGGALILKTIELGGLSDRLELPVETFSLLTLSLVIIIISHIVYRNSAILSVLRKKLTLLYAKGNAFITLPSDQLWIIGLIGYIASVMTVGQSESASTGVGLKFIGGFLFLKYIPFTILFNEQKHSKNILLFLFLYFMALIVLGMLGNSRSTFADTFVIIISGFFVMAMLGSIKLDRVFFYRSIISLLFIIPLLKVLSLLGVAMLITRGIRADVSAVDLFYETLSAAFDAEKIEDYKYQELNQVSAISYLYLDNIFFSRLVFTKFHDNILYITQYMSSDAQSVWLDSLWKKTIANIPCPVTELLGLECEKQNLQFSGGDMAVRLAGVSEGGYATGSWIVEVYYLFDIFFIGIIFGLSLVVFFVYDAFSFLIKQNRVIISNIFFVNIYFLGGGIGNILTNETIVNIISSIIRGIPQMFLIYWIAIKISSLFCRSKK